MINLEKSGNVIKFTFTDNDHYLQNGVIEVPVNSLTLVTDGSDMFTFKKSATNDIFISGLYSEIGMPPAALEAFYKENMVGETGGGGGGVTSGDVQSMIDESISGKADTSAVTEAISAATDDMATETWVGEQGYITQDEVVVNQAFPSGWTTDGTMAELIEDINSDSNAVKGKSYLSTVSLSDLPANLRQGELKAEIMDDEEGLGKVIQFTLTSSDTPPYNWEYTSAYGETNDWRSYLTEHQSLSAYSTTNEMNAAISAATSGKADIGDIPDVSNYFDNAEYDSGTTRINFYHGNTIKAYIDASAFVVDGMIDDVRIETISGVTYLVIDFNTESGKEDIQIPITDIFNPDNYYDKTAIDNIVSGLNDSIDTKLDASAYTPTDLSDYWTSAQTESAINEATSGKIDTSDFSAHTANTTIHVTAEQTSAWDAKSDFSGSYNDLTDKPTIPTVPTSNSAFTNDAGYITEDALSGYAESSAVTEEITAAVSGKQDTLSAGTGIDITDNVISATGGGGGKAISAGTNISITTGETADTVSCTLNLENGTNSQSGGIKLKSSVAGNNVSGRDAAAFGAGNTATGVNSFVCGYNNTGNTPSAFVSGSRNNATNQYESLFGLWSLSNGNVTSDFTGDSGATLFVVGNGEWRSQQRHNAFEIRQNGDIYIANTDDTSTTNYYQKPMVRLQDYLGGGGSSYSAGTGIDITNDVISVSGVVETSAITSAITSASTDSEVASAKAVYDIVPTVTNTIASGSTDAVTAGAVYDAIGDIETLLSQI